MRCQQKYDIGALNKNTAELGLVMCVGIQILDTKQVLNCKFLTHWKKKHVDNLNIWFSTLKTVLEPTGIWSHARRWDKQ
jgi:hypothetical protein